MGSHVTDPTVLRRLVADFPPYFSQIFDLDAFLVDATPRLPLTLPEAIALLQGAALIGRDKPHAQWGHKMPSEWPYVPIWAKWFPQARFLHIVRHPHDATASMVQYQLQRYRTTPLVAIWQWRKAFRFIRRHGSEFGPQRYHLLRYEDLVADPDTILAQACHFLGVSSGEVARMKDYQSDPSAAYVDEGKHMERTKAELTKGRIGQAEQFYTPQEAAMLDHLCRAELGQLGYQPRAPRPAAAVRALAYDAACRGLDMAWASLRVSRRLRGQL
jgi:hypothetical protein